MQIQSTNHSQDVSQSLLIMAGEADHDVSAVEAGQKLEPMVFYSQYVDHMELYADTHAVAHYFDTHHEWFRRCAHPMTAELIGDNAYALVIGRFGAFGYEVEPKIGLNLLPQQEGVYRIETVPVPDQAFPGYEVDFKAAMELIDLPAEALTAQDDLADLNPVTRVQWKLDLWVTIQFPKFIYALPKNLLQKTGDRLLHQIVRQVSHRLTKKVQEDFHHSVGVTLSPQMKRKRNR